MIRSGRRAFLPGGALLAFALVGSSGPGFSARAGDVEFDRIVIDDKFPGAYQVEVADVNGDRKPDVIAVGGGTCAWFENPTWKKRVVTGPKQTPGVISSATADIDGDGKAEIAIAYEFAMNEPTKGKLLLASQGKGIEDAWTLSHLADVGSIHRLRFAKVDHEAPPALVVAPIFGPTAKPPTFQQEGAQILIFQRRLGARPGTGGLGGGDSHPKGVPSPPWFQRKLDPLPVLHAIDVVDFAGDGSQEILGASNLGVTCFHLLATGSTFERLVAGAPGSAPKTGASEVHIGRRKSGRRFLATIEPWHGTDVAIYLARGLTRTLEIGAGSVVPERKFGPRTRIDDTLTDGHALWVADVDGDGDDEVFAGHRGKDHRVSMYDFDGKIWVRTVLDRDIAAQDLRGGDLDANGVPDVVAVGGSTHNVVWYRPRAVVASKRD
jgi:hypothetical protein